jgi:hypothetical protein
LSTIKRSLSLSLSPFSLFENIISSLQDGSETIWTYQ